MQKGAINQTEHERTFLRFQRVLREGGTLILNEAMLVLDVIDSKTSSLLSYISLSFAAMVFLITSLPGSAFLTVGFFDDRALIMSVLAIILALLVAILLCLSCLNIIGSHTIAHLSVTTELDERIYEDYVVRLTISRRRRYRAAHQVSVVTAMFMIILFISILVGSLQGHVDSTVSVGGSNEFSYSPLADTQTALA